MKTESSITVLNDCQRSSGRPPVASAARFKFLIFNFEFPLALSDRRWADNRHSSFVIRHCAHAFSLVELMLAVSLLSLIVLALMTVFNSTQQAFRASVTQSDVLENSRAAVDMITTDLRGMAASGGTTYEAMNFAVWDNNTNAPYPDPSYANGYALPAIHYQPLPQLMVGGSVPRTNVLNWLFLLGRENTKWTGVGYVVNAGSDSPLYPLYRFYAETNISVPPFNLYSNFLVKVASSQWTNLSHVMDGVVHFTVRAYDTNGIWLTNGYTGNANNWMIRNIQFYPPSGGEVGCFFYSNSLPASVELQMGVLEDRALQRAESLPAGNIRSNYLAGQAGAVHLFRQRVNLPNFDPAAYQ